MCISLKSWCDALIDSRTTEFYCGVVASPNEESGGIAKQPCERYKRKSWSIRCNNREHVALADISPLILRKSWNERPVVVSSLKFERRFGSSEKGLYNTLRSCVSRLLVVNGRRRASQTDNIAWARVWLTNQRLVKTRQVSDGQLR